MKVQFWPTALSLPIFFFFFFFYLAISSFSADLKFSSSEIIETLILMEYSGNKKVQKT